jgi:hypothetical protein
METRRVHKYDGKTGEYIESYPNAGVAEKAVGLVPYKSTISHAIKNKSKSAGFYWSYEEKPNYFLQIEDKQHSSTKDGYLEAEELRRKHDLFYKLKTEVMKIPKGRFIEEERLLRRIGIYGKAGSKKACDRLKSEMPEYRGRADGVTYFGHPESIAEFKAEGVLTT